MKRNNKWKIMVGVTARMVLRREIIAILLMLAVPTAALAVDTTTALGEPHTDGTPKVAPAAPTHSTPGSLQEKATDPSSVLFQLQFQYHNLNTAQEQISSSKVIIQPVMPITKKNAVRATLPYFSSPVSGQRERGIGDLVILDFQLIQTKHSTVGIGPAVSLPTASEDAFGSGKFSLGPGVLWVYKGIKRMQVGLLSEYFVSVAGDSARADVSEFLFQPIYTRHFKWGYVGWSSQQWSYDFETSTYKIELGAVIGKVFMSSKTTPWNIQFEPYYTVNQRGENEWNVKFQFTLIRPGFKW